MKLRLILFSILVSFSLFSQKYDFADVKIQVKNFKYFWEDIEDFDSKDSYNNYKSEISVKDSNDNKEVYQLFLNTIQEDNNYELAEAVYIYKEDVFLAKVGIQPITQVLSVIKDGQVVHQERPLHNDGLKEMLVSGFIAWYRTEKELDGDILTNLCDDCGLITGKIMDMYEDSEIEDVKVDILRYDNIIRSTETNASGYFTLDSIEMGYYKLRISHPDYFSIIYKDVAVVSPEEIYVEESMDRVFEDVFYNGAYNPNDFGDFAPLLGLGISYMDGSMMESEDYKRVLGFQYKMAMPPLKITSFDYIKFEIYMLNMNWYIMNNDSSLYNQLPQKKDFYFGNDFTINILNSVIFEKGGIYNNYGFQLDFGIGYNLPTYFRYVTADGKYKTKLKGLRKFNDFHVVAKLGYSSFAFRAEYKLNNSIKDGFPELPRLTFGIDLMFPAY